MPGTVAGAPALLPTGITSFGAAVVGNQLYVLGGFHGEPHDYVAEDQSRALMRLDLDGNSDWQALPGLEAGVQSVALVARADGLHRLGGMRVGEPGELRSIDEHARYADGRWESLPGLPEPRSSHDAVAHGDRLFVLGGWRLDGDRAGTFYEDMWVYDDDGGWQREPTPVKRRALAVAATDQHIVAVGGFTPDRDVSTRVDVFRVADKQWSEGPAFPGEGFGVAATGSGDTVYASGRDGVVWAWRVGDAEWRRATDLAFPRFFHQLLSAGDDRLVAVGGIGGMHTDGRTRHVEVFNPRQPSTAPSLVRWTLPSPGAAKNRQGAFLSGDHLVLFGGNNSLGQHDFEAENFLADGHAIHVPSLAVQPAAPYPVPRQSMQTVVGDGIGLSVGGFGHDGKVARTHGEVFAYDARSNAWSSRPGLPGTRSQFGLASHGDALWVFGGLDYDPTRAGKDQFRHQTSVLRAPADGSAPFADSGIELPGPRRAFGGVAHEGKFYMVGGMRGGFQLVEDCAAFDFEREAFSPIACPRRVRLNPQLVAVGNRLVLVGGSSKVDGKLGPDRTIEVYDPAAGTWSTLALELPLPARHLRAFAYRDRLLLYSAHNDNGVVELALVTLGEP